MFFLFFYAWSQGDVTRLTQGYDVSGNICGKDNEPVVLEDGKTVLFSGVDMSSRPFMYIDLIRTAQITGGDALDDVVGGIGHNLTDKSSSDDGAKLLFHHEHHSRSNHKYNINITTNNNHHNCC